MVTATVQTAIREAASDDARRLVQSYRVAGREVARLSEQGAKAIAAAIDDFRRELRDRLSILAPDGSVPFLARLAPTINDEINRSIQNLIASSTAGVQGILAESFALGAELPLKALTAAAIPLEFQGISPALLTTLSTATADAITETFTNLGSRITSTVRLSVAGLEPVSATLQRISTLLRTSDEFAFGIRRRIGVGFQAESMARTEIGRMYSAAQHAASVQISEQVPGLTKRWVTRLRERRGHQDVEAATAERGIPVRQRFIVRDFSRTGRTEFITFGRRIRPFGWSPAGQRVAKIEAYDRRGRIVTDRMLFPRDPAGSPGNVINCSCLVIEVPPGLEDFVDQQVQTSRED